MTTSQPSKTRQGFANGFTLIELLVVLAIVAVLLTIVTPAYVNKIDTSKETVLRDNLRTTRSVIDQFYGDTGRYPESLDELVEQKYLQSLPVDPMTDSSQTWQLIDVPTGYQGQVYDLKSTAPGTGRNGIPYEQW